MLELVRRPSVNGQHEESFSEWLAGFLREVLPRAQIREKQIPGHGRAFLVTGHADGRPVLLLGHFDTVDVEDYGPLSGIAWEPDALRDAIPDVFELTPGQEADLKDPRYLWGRGALDMKAGIALLLLVFREAQQHNWPVALLLVPDEEGDSMGARLAVPWALQQLPEPWGVIKADFTEERGAIYFGTIGKVLLNVLVRGRSTHAGDPGAGVPSIRVAAELVRVAARAWKPEPVCLLFRDLAPRYSTQVPPFTWLAINVLLQNEDPREVLLRFQEVFSARVGQKYGLPVAILEWGQPLPPHGEPRFQARDLAVQSISEPGIYLFFSPPFYPAVAPSSSPFHQVIRRVVRRWNRRQEMRFRIRSFYPFISDLSFFQAQDAVWRAWRRHSPVDVPFEAPSLSLPVADIGPFGQGSHSWAERVDLEYTLQLLPRIYKEILNTLARG